MKNNALAFATDFAKRLLVVTESCDVDMREPDQVGISARVTGLHLDNAMGDHPITNHQEITVGIKKETYDPSGSDTHQWFNLATLIALARLGAKVLLETEKD